MSRRSGVGLPQTSSQSCSQRNSCYVMLEEQLRETVATVYEVGSVAKVNCSAGECRLLAEWHMADGAKWDPARLLEAHSTCST